MRRFRRWIFNAAALLSLVICVAAAWLWSRSYRHMPGAVWTKTTRISDAGRFVERWEFETYCCHGGLLVEWARWRYSYDGLQAARIDPHRWGEDRRWDVWKSDRPLVQPYPTIPPNYRGTPAHDYLGRGGFQFCAVGIGSWSYSGHAAVLPCWFLTALLAVLPAVALRRLVRGGAARQRERRGLCRRCGYDLRATPGRCPECGRVPGAA